MALIAITGTLYDAAGTGVQNALLRLSPAPYAAESAEAIGGIGIVSDPVESVSASGGTFSVNAVQGFRYRLEIPSINFDRSFVAPAGSTIRFDLLGLRPEVESAPNGEDADGATQTFLLVKANPIDTVRERYDQIIVQRATTLAGSYTTVATVDLLPGPVHKRRIGGHVCGRGRCQRRTRDSRITSGERGRTERVVPIRGRSVPG